MITLEKLMSQGSLGHGLRPGRGRLGHTTLRTFAFSLSLPSLSVFERAYKNKKKAVAN